MVQLLALHAPFQQRVVLLTQQVDLAQQVVVLLLQVPFEATQELGAHTEEAVTTLQPVNQPFQKNVRLPHSGCLV